MQHRFTVLFLSSVLLLLITTSSFFVFAQAPPGGPVGDPLITETSTSSASPSPTITPPTPSPSATPSPPPWVDDWLPCDETWILELDYNPNQAVRFGQVDFVLTLPGYVYGHVPNNPRIRTGYQLPNTPVLGSSVVITQWNRNLRQYIGYILMDVADVVIMDFDLWCMDFGINEPVLKKTYSWTIPETGVPYVSPTPNATISDIRYVSFALALDADVALDPVGIFVESQVQLRNLKSNL